MPQSRSPFITLIKVISVLALVSLLVVVGLYFLQFRGALSPDDHQWAQFGEYVGGVLGPLYSLLALIGVLRTLELQRQSIEDTQRQQFDGAFFNLVQSLARIREGTTTRASPGIVPNLVTSSRVQQVSMQLLIRDAWEALKRLMNERTEDNESAARLHLMEVAGELRREYDDVFRLTDKILQLYRFVYRASLSPETKGYYVEIVNSEVTSVELTLLLIALLTQPPNGAALRVANDLKVFMTLELRTLGIELLPVPLTPPSA